MMKPTLSTLWDLHKLLISSLSSDVITGASPALQYAISDNLLRKDYKINMRMKIVWLHQKAADLDLHCFQKRI